MLAYALIKLGMALYLFKIPTKSHHTGNTNHHSNHDKKLTAELHHGGLGQICPLPHL